ncbi:MAG: FAD-dependent oxidoreductase [Dehalococcoidia bacterium]
METDYLIIGNSAGGIGAIEAIRSVDSKGSITVVSDEPYPAYSRPLISEYLAGERDLNGMLYRPPDFYEKMGTVKMFGNVAVSLDLQARQLELDNRQKVAYRSILLATGGKPIVPPIEGLKRKGVHTFTRLDDAKAIAGETEEGAKKAVVIGGGLIGISLAEALHKRGIRVTIVELMERILGAVLDEEASKMAENAVRQAGIEIMTGHTVESVIGKSGDEGRAGGAVLDSGDTIECDLLVVAIGVQPNTDLVRNTDIEVGRGILVDRQMAAGFPGVYACGDVAECYDFIHGEERVVPVWPNAHIGGRIAGYNMAGRNADYPGGTAINSLKYFGLPIASAGIVNPTGNDEGYEVLSRRDEDRYQKFVLRDGRLVGMVLVRDIERSGIMFGLMRDGVDIGSCRESLLSDEFGLISLPEDLLRKRLALPDLGRLHLLDEPEAAEKVTAGV